jgi:hypothetical protein
VLRPVMSVIHHLQQHRQILNYRRAMVATAAYPVVLCTLARPRSMELILAGVAGTTY